ncbi:hypothetical protein LRS04_15975 [Phenylobacterium sp. J367]|nr:hypothetical protein [Phenylobacterium sp. J367]MCR5879664.1 hypothetical protein [Phenylobacterium sp. J367]
MTVRRTDQPEQDLAFQHQGLVRQGVIAFAQLLQQVDHAWPSLALVLAARGDRQRLAEVLLRQAQELRPVAPPAIEPLDDQDAPSAEGGHLGSGDGKAEATEQGETIVLVLHAVLQIDEPPGRRNFAQLRLEDMGRGRRAQRTHPSAVVTQQRRLLLGAGHGDAELLLGVDTERATREIGEHGLDLFVAERHALRRLQRVHCFAGRQKLHRPHAVASDLLQEAERVHAAGAGAFGDPATYLRAVGQQVVEHRDHGFATPRRRA